MTSCISPCDSQWTSLVISPRVRAPLVVCRVNVSRSFRSAVPCSCTFCRVRPLSTGILLLLLQLGTICFWRRSRFQCVSASNYQKLRGKHSQTHNKLPGEPRGSGSSWSRLWTCAARALTSSSLKSEDQSCWPATRSSECAAMWASSYPFNAHGEGSALSVVPAAILRQTSFRWNVYWSSYCRTFLLNVLFIPNIRPLCPFVHHSG